MGKIGIGISKEQLSQKSFQDYDRIFLLLDQEDRYDGETETFPRQTCVTIRFCGSHREAPAYYQKLLAYIEEKKTLYHRIFQRNHVDRLWNYKQYR